MYLAMKVLGAVGVLSVCLLVCSAPGLDLSDVVVTIITQTNDHHVSMATEKQQMWRGQFNQETSPIVVLSTDLATEGEGWTIAPLLTPLWNGYNTSSWFVVVTEWTEVDFSRLRTILDSHSPQQDLFVGHALFDQTSTILHHYSNLRTLGYPLLESGFILSAAALMKVVDHVNKFNPSFNIDAPYEFAQFLKFLRTPSVNELFPDPPPPHPDGLALIHNPRLCPAHSSLGENCATTYSHQLRSCRRRVELNTVFFAVKTCTSYHATRLPVVQSTWAADLPGDSVGYYSDSEDLHFHTTDIGVPNTERGHCGKMEAILRLFGKETALRGQRWLVIADDDTLLSVGRLLDLLSCYDHTRPILLGEVYGYGAHRDGGLTYVTGGGSMIVSQSAVASFISSGRKCPSLDYPDDMFLGALGQQLGWDIVHSPLFHQSQPSAYHPTLLSSQRPVSFHKHSPNDPILVYEEYLVDSDTDSNHRDEL